MVLTQIQLTEEQANKLKGLASSLHLSVAEVIRQAVDRMMKIGVQEDMEEKRKRAIDAAGKFSSGIRDLSVEHDKYLEDAYRA